jgi:hypothetical protein
MNTKTKMSRSEKIVTSLAVALLVAGLASGVFAKPTGMTEAFAAIHAMVP